MTTRNKTLFTQFCSASVGNLLFAICLAFCTVALAPASAQEPHIITFDAPGADTKPGDFNGTYPGSSNFWGVITGSYQDTNSTFHGFVRSPEGTFTTFEAPGADLGSFNGTAPCCINDLGAITGVYYDKTGFSHGFVRSPEGKFTSVDVPGVGGYGSTPLAINLEGAVAGYYTDSNYSFHAFLRSPEGRFTTWIGPDSCTGNGSEGCYGSAASNINVFGIVVGSYEDNSGNFVGHSYVRTPDGKLNTFEVPGAGTGGYQGTGCPSDCPTSLNDFGAIMGTYIDTNGVLHGYLRSPNGNITTVDPVGSVFTWSSAINDLGAITGYYADVNDVYHGFVAVPCDHWCSENDEAATAATRLSPATTTNRVNEAFNRVPNPKLGLIPWNRSAGVQPSK